MARGRRRGAVVRKHRDWVYRPNSVASAAPLNSVDGLGTYEFAVRSLTTGQASAQVLWLVDAEDRDTMIARTSSAASGFLSAAAKPSTARRKTLMVEGQMYFEPSTWALGNVLAVGMRIIVCEQDVLTGLGSLDADYTMWNPTTVGQQAAFFANDRQLNLAERRMWWGFSDNGQVMQARFRLRVPWTLQPHHGLGLYLESPTTSVNLRYQTWLRTLVEA